ncbi:hypothetical protein llap_11617 [Limosa lapponica baueri]|uniref:Uncharacterized protein n=1 Tax=Limosa lapponica baueri TaxID=1758121 RepID=A0A2I0TW84_LIMLA|nr:hypothetical protein llap_11617 [Limosa lapponica baueri]
MVGSWNKGQLGAGPTQPGKRTARDWPDHRAADIAMTCLLLDYPTPFLLLEPFGFAEIRKEQCRQAVSTLEAYRLGDAVGEQDRINYHKGLN